MDLSLSRAEQSALFTAFDRSSAIIIFDPSGKILSANDKFLEIMGYGREIIGQMHSIFVHPEDRRDGTQALFWDRLRAGGFHSGEYRRMGSHNRELWLSAAYNPLLEDSGKVVKIIMIARDVTEEKRRGANIENQMRALDRSLAVIEFDLRGHIIDANANFLTVAGYELNEIVGKHHNIFVDPAIPRPEEYKRFWQELGQGHYRVREVRRLGKGGKPFWIRASYNPIVDAKGRTTGVIEYSLDITENENRARVHQAMAASEELLHRVLEQVGGIACTIDGITRQTRLLALNARIEAARVGDAGRSFAVVASEIAGLSSRTADMTSYIAKLILAGDKQSREVTSLFGAALERHNEAKLALHAARR